MQNNQLQEREYLDANLMPALLQALAKAADEKPEDPLTYIANFMLEKQESYQKKDDSDPLVDLKGEEEEKKETAEPLKKELQEDQWKDIIIEGDIKTPSHQCVMKSKGLTDSGWKCDKLKGQQKCFSGLTEFDQSS